MTVKTHCGSGLHLWIDANIATRKSTGKRYCRPCAAEALRVYREAHRKPKAPTPTKRTHCVHGHELTDDNVYIKQNGYEYCRTCHNEESRRSMANRAAATKPTKAIIAKPIARVAPVPQPPIVPPKVGSVELRADDKGYIARGNWKCPSPDSPTGAHHSEIVGYSCRCRYCGAERVVPITGEMVELHAVT